MDKVEYNAIKKALMAQLGANDAESLNFYAKKMEKHSKMYKWISILMGIASLPLSLIIIGIPLLLASIGLYFFGYRKIAKKAKMFRDHVNSDPELSQA